MKDFCLIYTLSTPWDGYHRRPFIEHIADAIKPYKGYILCIEPSLTSIHTLILYPERIKNWIKGKYKFRKVYDNIFSFCPKTFEQTLLSIRFYPLLYLNRIVIKKQIKKALQKINKPIKHVILVLHRPELFFLKDTYNYKGLLYDCWDDFCMTISMKELKVKGNYIREKLIAKESDFIITTSSKLYKRNYENNPNTYLFENGFCEKRFSNRIEIEILPNIYNECIKNLKRPIIGYIGNIKYWIDFSLVEYLVKNRDEWTFMFVGPYWTEYGKKYIDLTEKYDNIVITGYIDYNLFPAYLKQFDVGIIPFIQNEFMESCNPNKFYEYIGANIPVVSTDIGDLKKKYSDIIRIASTPIEFLNCLDEIVNMNDDKVKILKRQISKVAAQHTWESKAAYFIELLKKHVFSNGKN